MMTKEEVLCALNRWEWPASIEAFSDKEQRQIILAVWRAAEEFCPHDQWIKTWQEQLDKCPVAAE